uniref:U3 small nucleolar RNA-associated protein 14 n=1 Tax=Panagrolaimus sp. JU765 TaxID=591449 RepID=A0AC34QN01_9BILA
MIFICFCMSDSEDNSPDLSTINWRNGKSSGFNPTTEAPKVDELDLLTSIQTAKNLSDLKEHYRKKKEIEVLEAPLSQLDQARIDREIAFEKTKKDLDQWQHIVNEGRVNRLVIKPKVPEGDVEFKPRTELEKQMDEVLKKSRKTRSTDDNIASAEEEILKAMNFEVARENFLKLQTMRRQMGYQEAKFRRQAKIKSKTYHRIKKRQERRTVLKEFEELVAKDPDAAKAKLDMLETDRIFERAELRHRGQNKWSKELRQYASKNPEIEKTLADHLHYHRELKQKYGKGAFSSSEDEEDEPRKLGLEDVMKLAADEASNATSQIMPEIETVAKNPWLSDELTRLRNTKANIANKMILKESVPEKPEFEVDPEFSTSLVSIVKEQTQAEIKAKVEAATKKNILDAERICNSTVFDNLNDPLYEYDGIDEQKTDSEDDKLLDKKKNKMREKKKRQRERRIIRKEKEKKREAHFEKVEEAKKKKDEKRKMAKEAMKKSKEKKGKKGVNVKDGEENEINGENNGKKDMSEKNKINGENNEKKDVVFLNLSASPEGCKNKPFI